VKIITSPSSATKISRLSRRPLVLVPTMGALHEGHMALVRRARALAGPDGTVAVSIFVNPTQFGPNEDFSKYPRPIKEDAALCREAGVDLLFIPTAAAMYAPDHSVWVDESLLSGVLCGASRPGHFRGVCTVVSKLFNILGPDIAVFGKKDAQQLAIVRRLVRDLNFPVKIVGLDTVRECDGLALSSRNRYLTPEERAQAPVLRQALLSVKQAWARGDAPVEIRRSVAAQIEKAPLARIDYVEVSDAETLGVPGPQSKRLLIAVAVFFGKTRLIDNLEIGR
jgi:pantoate--beta-alanine ligase